MEGGDKLYVLLTSGLTGGWRLGCMGFDPLGKIPHTSWTNTEKNLVKSEVLTAVLRLGPSEASLPTFQGNLLPPSSGYN
jgi:hypothetical protein